METAKLCKYNVFGYLTLNVCLRKLLCNTVLQKWYLMDTGIHSLNFTGIMP